MNERISISKKLDGFSHGEALPHHDVFEHRGRTFGHEKMDPNAVEYRASLKFSGINEDLARHLEYLFIEFFGRTTTEVFHRATIVDNRLSRKKYKYDTTTLVFGFPLSAAHNIQEALKRIGEVTLLTAEMAEIFQHIRKRPILAARVRSPRQLAALTK